MPDQPSGIAGGAQLRTIAMPRDTNANGSIFGGWTLSQMDLASGTLAAERAEKVTEGVFTYVALCEDGHPRELPAERAE